MKRKGEFLLQRTKRQRQAAVYQTLNVACKKAMATGSSTVTVGGKRFSLTSAEAGDGFYTYRVMLRFRRYGIVYARVSSKDSGHVSILFPIRKLISGINSFAWKNIAAYVSKVEDVSTGVDITNSI